VERPSASIDGPRIATMSPPVKVDRSVLLAAVLASCSCAFAPEPEARLGPEDGLGRPRPPLAGALALASAEAAEIEGLRSLLVSFRGETVLERYHDGAGPRRTTNVKSVSKSLLAALIGIAIDQGWIDGVESPIGPYFERYLQGEDPRKREITVEDLLTMRSGLERTSGRNYGAWVSSRSWIGYALHQPLIGEPGRSVEYSTGSSHLLSALLTKAAGESTWSFAQKNLARPMGFEIGRWTRDPEGFFFGGNEMGLTPRQMLDFGRLYLNGGRTPGGEQVVSEQWVEDSCVPRGRSSRSGRRYGYGWWIRELADREVCYAWGYGGQFIFVVRDLDLVVVTTSSTDPDSRQGRNGRIYAVVGRLIENIAASDAFGPRRPKISDCAECYTDATF
jgi:CubicO group peptidase (beta-lactamase class C family)